MNNLPNIQLGPADWVILILYFSFVVGIGVVLKRGMKSSSDFFLSGRAIPAWIAGLAFLSANLGAQEVMGMAASGAKYGMMTAHFYWVGAVPPCPQGTPRLPRLWTSMSRLCPTEMPRVRRNSAGGFQLQGARVLSVVHGPADGSYGRKSDRARSAAFNPACN